MRLTPLQYAGIAGTVASLVLFFSQPSFPTPDKLLVFLTFIFLIFGQAKAMLKRLAPFVAILLVYESFRGLVPSLNARVEYQWMIDADKMLFGTLPTASLQDWLWHGAVRWYDFVFYLAYLLHFILPIGLAIFVWRKRPKLYWPVVMAFAVVSFMGFVTFLLFPAAPPWMAAENGYIEPIVRVSSHVWFSLGLQDFPSVYNQISPNPVAAVPSLHAAYATLFAIFITKLFSNRWRLAAWVYPLLIYVGTVYQGEHYAVDALLGAAYALAAFWLVLHIWPKLLQAAKVRISRGYAKS